MGRGNSAKKKSKKPSLTSLMNEAVKCVGEEEVVGIAGKVKRGLDDMTVLRAAITGQRQTNDPEEEVIPLSHAEANALRNRFSSVVPKALSDTQIRRAEYAKFSRVGAQNAEAETPVVEQASEVISRAPSADEIWDRHESDNSAGKEPDAFTY